MIDLHSHILPGVDDGATDLEVALEMARMAVASGVEIQACTPHILPGLYHNSGDGIRAATNRFQRLLDENAIALRLVTGADVHLVPDIVAGIREGRILSLNDTRYVLIEPPHHVAPPRLVESFFNVLLGGYVPILTHPERLTWIETHYAAIEQLFHSGVWMQITAGSLVGAFGRRPRYWAERMLDEGRVHIVASDAHGVGRRRPNLDQGREAAAKRVGEMEAGHLVATRPAGILANVAPSSLPAPHSTTSRSDNRSAAKKRYGEAHGTEVFENIESDSNRRLDIIGRMRAIFR